MKPYLADAFFFFAWWNRRDRAHGRVQSFLAGFAGHLVTTRWVLMEVADGLASTPARREERMLFEDLASDPRVSK
jgi:predicted nucleic acid-binding protein